MHAPETTWAVIIIETRKTTKAYKRKISSLLHTLKKLEVD